MTNIVCIEQQRHDCLHASGACIAKPLHRHFTGEIPPSLLMTDIVCVEQQCHDCLHSEPCVADSSHSLMRFGLFANLLWRMTSSTDILRTPCILLSRSRFHSGSW
ncbi:hypothetical protein NEOLEDRAFT_348261 [Neolentinus lepideus HHB14362 ss-1]|uniref:Uncharacterized protein n=1 Tax=Neolentinus lepideus HHB14362 ss-1 TaxID=1314782 RepID=A0A165SQY4_9AGAM|nr:hypothetical protein NEOLEDRAFT_348261 [Neolentinus lepideus HHB14362 ss-1]